MARSERSGADALPGLAAAVLDALPVALYVVDRDLRVVAWNSLREQGPIGKPRRQVLGRHLRDALSPRGFRATLPVIEEVFLTGSPRETAMETAGGRLFHVRRLPVLAGREVTHVLSLFEDVTERRALEMRLIASDRLAYLGQLVAGVAHEVSNPLAGIAGCAEALASLAQKPRSPEQRHEVEQFRDLIRGEVARCERIVRSLLEAARPAPGTSADLAATVETALRLLVRNPAFERMRVVVRVAAELPHARIDPDSLRQVVMALALNAARAMSGLGTLTLRGGRAGRLLFLDVLDSGPGVPAAIRSRIFEPFFTTRPGEGTGLGLAIARSLVRGHGGDIALRASRGHGGAFRVTLEPVAA